MRIKQITVRHNRPISYDQVEIEDTNGNKFFFVDPDIDELVERQQKEEEFYHGID